MQLKKLLSIALLITTVFFTAGFATDTELVSASEPTVKALIVAGGGGGGGSTAGGGGAGGVLPVAAHNIGAGSYPVTVGDGGATAPTQTPGNSGENSVFDTLTAIGGGGGGGWLYAQGTGGAGGSGIVIIAYKTDGSDGVSTSSTGGTITTSGANTIHTFTSSGTWTMVAAGGGFTPTPLMHMRMMAGGGV